MNFSQITLIEDLVFVGVHLIVCLIFGWLANKVYQRFDFYSGSQIIASGILLGSAAGLGWLSLLVAPEALVSLPVVRYSSFIAIPVIVGLAVEFGPTLFKEDDEGYVANTVSESFYSGFAFSVGYMAIRYFHAT